MFSFSFSSDSVATACSSSSVSFFPSSSSSSASASSSSSSSSSSVSSVSSSSSSSLTSTSSDPLSLPLFMDSLPSNFSQNPGLLAIASLLPDDNIPKRPSSEKNAAVSKTTVFKKAPSEFQTKERSRRSDCRRRKRDGIVF
eukprot:TRINITY_DN1719_c0_g1_i2.p1 TRINITY_DN1719_c0_g1~~TRINITY_DN1719_c0_g1_i2.p1  ORF type:complete len:158 (-),score=72.55 TRINITY_DN1719_c0_g1_i2:323-745(-)